MLIRTYKDIAHRRQWYRECQRQKVPFVVYCLRPKTVRIEWSLLPCGISYLSEADTEELRDVMRPFFPAGYWFDYGWCATNVISRDQWEVFRETVFPVLDRVARAQEVRALGV